MTFYLDSISKYIYILSCVPPISAHLYINPFLSLLSSDAYISLSNIFHELLRRNVRPLCPVLSNAA